MTDLHPHWHSTGDDDSVVQQSNRACPAERSGVHINIQPASRLPAAIAGIAVFTVLGITLAGGWQAVSQVFTAQVAGGSSSSAATPAAPAGPLTPAEIHISASNGFQPASVTVKPGQQIIWINDQSIPHILTSQTLRDGSGAYLNTPAIFPGAQVTFTVGPKEGDKTHSIISTTDQTLAGTVIVSATGTAKASSSSRKAPLGSTDGINLPSGQGNVNTGGTARSSSASKKSSSSKQGSAASAAGNAPPPVSGQPAAMDPNANPYAGGTPQTIDVYTPVDITPSNDGANQDVIAPQTPAAKEQPNTGPGLWAVVLMSMAVLWGVTRKYFVMPTR